MKPIAALGLALIVAGCGQMPAMPDLRFSGPGPEPVVEPVGARATVEPLVLAQVPGDGGAVLVDCVLLNATEEETATLAAAAGTEPSEEVVALISDILAREGTITCATEALAG